MSPRSGADSGQGVDFGGTVKAKSGLEEVPERKQIQRVLYTIPPIFIKLLYCGSFGRIVLGKLKCRRFYSGFRSRRTGLSTASDLSGHCQDCIPACKHGNSSGILDKKGSGSWNL